MSKPTFYRTGPDGVPVRYGLRHPDVRTIYQVNEEWKDLPATFFYNWTIAQINAAPDNGVAIFRLRLKYKKS